MTGPGKTMLSVEAAHQRLIGTVQPTAPESAPLPETVGRFLALPVAARRTQPPAAMSAMDGYALRAADAALGARLAVIETVYAGQPPRSVLGSGEAVRLFTGSELPQGADAVLVQEAAEPDGAGHITVAGPVAPGQHVRPEGLDFREGADLLPAGTRLTPAAIALAAAGGHAELSVRRRPVVALLSTGDELVPAGQAPGPGQIVDAVSPGLAALIAQAGGVPRSLGIAPDSAEGLAAAAEGFAGADLILTVGGASVGDKDLVKTALPGLALDFWTIAMRPGKPLLFGHHNGTPLLGLPGNPVSALVCAHLFALPLIERLAGGAGALPMPVNARTSQALGANGRRRDFQRARLTRTEDGLTVTALPVQDSSMLSVLAEADALLVRPEHDGPRAAGSNVPVLPL